MNHQSPQRLKNIFCQFVPESPTLLQLKILAKIHNKANNELDEPNTMKVDCQLVELCAILSENRDLPYCQKTEPCRTVREQRPAVLSENRGLPSC